MKKLKALLITEKSSVAHDIEAVYNRIKDDLPYEIDIYPCAGHLFTFLEPSEYEDKDWKTWNVENLPMLLDASEWRLKYAGKNSSKYYKPIKQAYDTNHYDVIINCGDAGREGQLIQHLVYRMLGVNIPILRYWADDTSAATIEKTLHNLVDDREFQGLTDASFLRAYLDYLFGMNFSRAVTLATQSQSPISIGRVITPTLAGVVEREQEINNFVSTPYWEYQVTFSTANGQYIGKMMNPQGGSENPFRFLDKTVLINYENCIAEQCGCVKEVISEEKFNYAPSLYNISDLEKDASNQLGIRPAELDSIAQSLYDKHYLSYPRTESKYLTEEQVADIPVMLKSISGIPEISQIVNVVLQTPDLIQRVARNKKYVNNKKVSDHPALTPTSESVDLSNLKDIEKKVFIMVAKRFLSIFLPPQKSLVTTIFTEFNGALFRTKGSFILDNGFMGLYRNNNDKQDNILPVVHQGQSVCMTKKELLEKKTQPPKYYTYATLIRMMETAGKTLNDEELEQVLMECAGLGTPATRSETIQKLITLKYIKEENKFIRPTERGMQIINVLHGRDITSASLTANWEKSLKAVERGELSFQQVYDVILEYTRRNTLDLLTLPPLPQEESSLGLCPKCQLKVLEGKKAYFCFGVIPQEDTGNANCDFFLPKVYGKAKITPDDVKLLLSGKETAEKKFQWDEIKTSSKLKLVDGKLSFVNNNKPRQKVGLCPKCGKTVYVGKKGYYCEGSLKSQGTCDFSIYYKIAETSVTPKMMSEILSHKETKEPLNIAFKGGGVASSKVRLADDFSKLELTTPPMATSICPCPFCDNGIVISFLNRYECSNRKQHICGFIVNNSIEWKEITPDEIVKLIHGEKFKKTLYSKKYKKEYEKEIFLDFDSSTKRYSVKYNANKTGPS